MRPKYKTTGCFRFFIFFILFLPAVYFGATYFRGENGLQIIRDTYHKIIGKAGAGKSSNEPKSDTYSAEDCKTELKKVQNENDELKRKLRERDNEIERLKSGPK